MVYIAILLNDVDRIFTYMYIVTLGVWISMGVRRNGVQLGPKGVWAIGEDEDLFTFK